MGEVGELYDSAAHLIGFDERDWDVLEQEAEVITAWIPEIVDEFYDTLYGLDVTARIFQEGERAQVERTLEHWIVSLVSGKKDVSFWNHQWVVALRHVQRGVNNLYMLTMMNRVQQCIVTRCLKHYDRERAAQVINAFLRLSGTVGALIAECYTDLLEEITEEGVSRVGMNPALLQRIKASQIRKTIEAYQKTTTA